MEDIRTIEGIGYITEVAKTLVDDIQMIWIVFFINGEKWEWYAKAAPMMIYDCPPVRVKMDVNPDNTVQSVHYLERL